MKAAELKKLSRKELVKLKGQIEKQIEKLDSQDMKAALDAAEKAAKAHGFSLKQLTGGAAPAAKPRKAKGKSAGTVNPAKYRNPDDAKQTWTGKGRRPEWIKAAQAKGVDIETFAI